MFRPVPLDLGSRDVPIAPLLGRAELAESDLTSQGVGANAEQGRGLGERHECTTNQGEPGACSGRKYA